MNAVARYADVFRMHRAALIACYELLPDEQGTFAAWEGGMSLIGIADHLAGSSQRLLGMLGEEAPAPLLDVSGSADLPSARSRLQESTENALLALRALNEEDLGRHVQAFGREMPVAALLDFLIQHEAHHKGQVWMMARMVGVKPPMFVKLG
ncbi:DinB family protein [Deinococcus phoenicis]|uniref:DinB family protein n=1 Tax=Deinococcus phoenicis TaxID=1476583 RepID=A0A016QMK2_9DEIO|nr:DinB family protein [Deinococcus phoenicis]EYB66994.1 DinB family protein [Deinococcus phoenicis]